MSCSTKTELERNLSVYLEMEQELSLFDLTVDGVAIWERMRRKVNHTILQERGLLGEYSLTSLSTRDYLHGLYLWARNVAIKNPYLSDEHEWLFWGHSRRKRGHDDTWWDIFCDPLHEHLNYDYVQLEDPFGEEVNVHRTPAKTERLRYLDLVEYTGTIQRKTGLAEPSLSDDSIDRLSGVSEHIQQTFGVRVNIEAIARDRLRRRRSRKWLYKRLLSRVNPDGIVLVKSFGKETFIEVCKETGIPVVELQHGALRKRDLAYHYPGDRTKETFPDYFFAFGDFWVEQVDLPLEDDAVYSVGYPYLELNRERLADSETENPNRILFISQGTIGDQLSEFAVDLRERIDERYEIVYKLHPGENSGWRSAYPRLVESDINVIDTNEVSLHELFAECGIQVGVSSTALYEGMGFDLDTFVVDLTDSSTMAPAIEDGHAELVHTVEELVDAIREKKGESPGEQTVSVFADDAISNVADALSDVQSHCGT